MRALAVRVAASQRADPYSLVQTGLGALGGVLHGAASLSAERMAVIMVMAGLFRRKARYPNTRL